jgi:hypothetical protein
MLNKLINFFKYYSYIIKLLIKLFKLIKLIFFNDLEVSSYVLYGTDRNNIGAPAAPVGLGGVWPAGGNPHNAGGGASIEATITAMIVSSVLTCGCY